MTVGTPGDMAQIIAGLTAAARQAQSVDALLAAVVAVLGERYDLCRVSLRAVRPETPDEVEVVAVWSREPSQLARGVRMPLRSTTLALIVTTGRAEIGSHVSPDDGLLHQILAGEGIRSYASAPLGDTARGAPVLSLSSSRSGAFSDDDVPLVDAIASVVADRLAALGPA